MSLTLTEEVLSSASPRSPEGGQGRYLVQIRDIGWVLAHFGRRSYAGAIQNRWFYFSDQGANHVDPATILSAYRIPET